MTYCAQRMRAIGMEGHKGHSAYSERSIIPDDGSLGSSGSITPPVSALTTVRANAGVAAPFSFEKAMTEARLLPTAACAVGHSAR
jgi:hypothetical protein